MLHIYAIILATALLVGALAAIIICICVDIVPIIKSRGSTLVSRDSVTQEQTRMLKKSLQRKQLTSSASADFVDRGQGRKSLPQNLIKRDRPRFASTPLSLLTGEQDENEGDVEYKTTTVIIEALPKKVLTENNNNNDVTKLENDVTMQVEEINENRENYANKTQSPYIKRKENIYTDNNATKHIGQTNMLQMTKSGSTTNIPGTRRTKSDILDPESPVTVKKGAMTYNARDSHVIIKEVFQQKSHPNTPNIRTSRSMPLNHEIEGISRRESPQLPEDSNKDSGYESRATPNSQNSVRSKVYGRYEKSAVKPRDFPMESRRSPVDNNGMPYRRESPTKRGESPSHGCSSHYCKWCELEKERCLNERGQRRSLPFRRTESFPENYHSNSSPRMGQKHLRKQHSFDDEDSGRNTVGFPYDHNKYCKNPHRGYSPCPDCFHHSNHQLYYPHNYHVESPDLMQQAGVSPVGISAVPGNPQIPRNPLPSSSSSSSSSGSSSRFRHLRQPLEDIQEDASDCYAIRGAEVTSTLDSRELLSQDDDTMPGSIDDNSMMSVSPIITSDKQPTFVSVSSS